MVGGVSQNISEEGGISFGYCSRNKRIRQETDANQFLQSQKALKIKESCHI